MTRRTLLTIAVLLAACGRRAPTDTADRVCWIVESKVPTVNPAGDTVGFATFRTVKCSPLVRGGGG